MPPVPRSRQARPRIEETLPRDGEDTTGAGAGAAPAGGSAGPEEAPLTTRLPSLPKIRTSTVGILEEKTILLYGPAGIGKSTLASEWAGGDMFFFDTAGELSDLEVYRGAVIDWPSFRAWCAAYKLDAEAEERQFKGCVIDTADMLGTFCAQHMRRRLGVVHESDADWGKGWSLIKEEFTSHLAKLAALPGGVIIVSHSNTKEIKKRNEVYDRNIPTLTGGVRDACVNMADLVLFVDWADDEDGDRVINTKPSKYHEAKERGRQPRLPAVIPWPIGQSGYQVLKSAWDEGGK